MRSYWLVPTNYNGLAQFCRKHWGPAFRLSRPTFRLISITPIKKPLNMVWMKLSN